MVYLLNCMHMYTSVKTFILGHAPITFCMLNSVRELQDVTELPPPLHYVEPQYSLVML